MDKLSRHQNNLDASYDAALDAGDREALETEAMEDEVLSDEELFSRLANKFCRWSTTFGYPQDVTFLEWAVETLRKERTPEEALEREEFEARMCEDKDFFADYAWAYMGTARGYSQGLIDWAWEKYQSERTPEHTQAWMTEKKLSDLQAGERTLRRWQLDGKGGVECIDYDDREKPSNAEYWNFNDDRV